MRSMRNLKTRHREKLDSIGIFAMSKIFDARVGRRRIFFRGAALANAARACGRDGERRLHTKLGGVTIIFFLL
jgi:hypothetical protein